MKKLILALILSGSLCAGQQKPFLVDIANIGMSGICSASEQFSWAGKWIFGIVGFGNFFYDKMDKVIVYLGVWGACSILEKQFKLAQDHCSKNVSENLKGIERGVNGIGSLVSLLCMIGFVTKKIPSSD